MRINTLLFFLSLIIVQSEILSFGMNQLAYIKGQKKEALLTKQQFEIQKLFEVSEFFKQSNFNIHLRNKNLSGLSEIKRTLSFAYQYPNINRSFLSGTTSNPSLDYLIKFNSTQNYLSYECDKIAWLNWNRISTFEFEGRYNAQIATLKMDINSGLINPLLNSFRLETNVFTPKQISNMPTPWMPGNANVKILKHKLVLNNVSKPEELILLLGSFPNANFFMNKQPGRLKAFDINNVQINMGNVEILLQDPIEGNILVPTTITNKGTEITFEVLQGGTTHGDIILLHNFPKNTSYFEIEHYNELSRSDDGIFINVGLPDCCYSKVNRIDTTVCNKLLINGKTYLSSGSYSDTLKANNCDSIVNYVITVLNTPVLDLGKDTLICEGVSLSLSSPTDSTRWSNGSITKTIIVSKPGVYWAEISTPCGIVRDTIVISAQKCNNSCNFQCTKFEWMKWTMKSRNTFTGSSTKGTVSLIEDINVGSLYASLTNYTLNTAKFTPANINLMPTPWMPGNPSITKLIHNLILNNLQERKELLLLLGEFPNSNLYSKPQIGKLRIYDRLNNLLDVSNICTVFRDQRPPHDSILLFYQNKELWFDVNGSSQADGGIIVLTNFPDSTYTIQIEHNNEISSKDDGIYINIGLPTCCTNTFNKVDTIVCEKIIIKGKTILNSSTYSDTIKTSNCDSIVDYEITIFNKPFIELGKDTIICEGDSLKLNSNSNSTSWSDGTTGKEITVNKAGLYWAELTNVCGVIRDSIFLNISSKPILDLGSDKLICPNQVDTIWSNDVNTIWQDGSVGPYFIVNKSGIISGTIKNICGEVSDSVVVSYYSSIPFSLPEDTLLCSGETIILNSPSDSTTWIDGTVGKNLIVNKPGIYWAEVKSQCDILRDSILILYQSKPILDLGSDIQICPNDVDTIWSNDVNTIWQDGSVGPYFIINKSGIVSGTLKSNCGDVVDSILVSYYSSIPFSLPKDTLLCDGETLQLSSPFDSTTWIDGTIGKSLIVNKPGIYWAEVKSQCDILRDSILILYQSKPILDLGSDRELCPNGFDTIWSNDVSTVWQDGSIGPYFIIKKAGKVIATKSNICGSVSDSILVSYFINSNVDLGPDTTICEGILLTLNSGSINTIWFDNTKGSTKQISKAGIYWASLISPCGTVSDSIRITEMKVFGNPYLPNDTFVCEGINLNLSIPIIDELWNNQFLNLININGPGKYWYSFKDICNNLGDTIEVFYDSIPQAFPSDNLVFCGSEVYRFSTGNSKTVWSDGTVGSEIRISKSGIYHYLVSNCCGNFSDSIQLEFIEDANFYLPNVFSPNGDQVNDVFPGPQFTADFEIEIYDRWGSLVFKSTNIHWTGSFKNQNVSPGVYAYIIRSKACSNQLKYGNVTVVR
ncbi:MAG: gliding motility-associated C-terminal domain-containing protein [Saprospiraceae bacterium]